MSWTAAVWLVVLLCVVQPLPMPYADYATVAPEERTPNYSIAGLCDERRAGRQRAPIESPGYPRHYNNYPDSTDCGIVIHAEEGQQILLEFSYIYIEYSKTCDYDYVKVYDGLDKNAPLLATYCGRKTLEDLFYRELNRGEWISSGNAMYILFHSDSSVNDRGYSAVYTIVNTCNKPTIENSYISPTEETVNYQESYSVTCMAGYTTYPSDPMVCQKDGTFDVTVACISIQFFLVNSAGEPSADAHGLLFARGGDNVGTVRDNKFSDLSASAICQEMGYTSARSWSSGRIMWPSVQMAHNVNVLLVDVECQTESFAQCSYETTKRGYSHRQDVFLNCGISEWAPEWSEDWAPDTNDDGSYNILQTHII